jgi:hypothetical protein
MIGSRNKSDAAKNATFAQMIIFTAGVIGPGPKEYVIDVAGP